MNVLSSRLSIFIRSFRNRPFNTFAVDASTRTEFPQFSSVSELSDYVENHLQSMDWKTLSNFLRFSNYITKQLPDGRDFRNSPAIKKLVSTAVGGFSSQDSNTAVQLLERISQLAPPNRNNSPIPLYLKDAGDIFCRLLLSNQISLSATDFALALKSICRLDVKEIQLCSFIEKNLPNLISEMTSRDCRNMMHVLYEMRMPRGDLHKMLGDRMVENLDEFKNRDVVESLTTFAYTRNFVFEVQKRCVELLTQHTGLFDSDELVTAAEALGQLNSFGLSISRPILEEIQKRVRSLRAPGLTTALDILCCITQANQSQFANEIIGLLASSPAAKTVRCEVVMAHAICCFNLQERKPLLQTLIKNLFAVESFNPSNLLRIVEIAESAKHDMDMKVELPQSIQSQLEQLYANQRIDFNTIMIKELSEKLPDKYQLAVETGIRVGPFMPSLVDEENKVVIDVQSSFFPIRLRRHLYEKLGFSAVIIRSGLIRSTRDERTNLEILQNLLAPAMLNMGRISSEELQAMNDARREIRSSHPSYSSNTKTFSSDRRSTTSSSRSSRDS